MTIITKFYKQFLIFFIILFVLNYAVDTFFENQKNSYLNVQTQLVQNQYNTQYKYLKIMSHDIYSMYQDNQKLISLFAQATNANSSSKAVIRNKMYKMLERRYKRLENMGIKQIQFHLKDSSSFLRMHSPEKFGDDLREIRKSVLLTNTTLLPSEGFEIGKILHGFRFVYPLFDADKKHIGSMEVSFSSDQVIQNITSKYLIDKHVLILKSAVSKSRWKESMLTFYDLCLGNPAYLIEKNSYMIKNDGKFHKTLELTSNKIPQNMKEGLAFSTPFIYNFNSVVSTYIPIKNSTQNNIAYIVLYSESDYLDSLHVEKNYTRMLMITILLLLFIFAIYVTITQRKLEQMAHFDKLTNLPNRAYFYIELEQEIKRAKRLKYNLALMFIDLDGFKNVNDTFGHNVGDELLIQTASRLQKSIRGVDIVARIGGDEFIVLLTNMKEIQAASLIAKNIIDILNNDFLINKQTINIGASIGISCYPNHASDIDTLVSNADEAMYQAKDSGKNNFVLYKNSET